METLKNIIGDLAVVGVIAAFLDMLLPEGSSRRGVKLVFGLYFVAILINPLVGFFSHNHFSMPDFSEAAVVSQEESQGFQDSDLLTRAEDSLAQEIAAKCKALYEKGTFEVSVSLTEQEVNGISIQCQGIDEGKERVTTNDIQTFIAKDYGVKKSKVEVIF